MKTLCTIPDRMLGLLMSIRFSEFYSSSDLVIRNVSNQKLEEDKDEFLALMREFLNTATSERIFEFKLRLDSTVSTFLEDEIQHQKKHKKHSIEMSPITTYSGTSLKKILANADQKILLISRLQKIIKIDTEGISNDLLNYAQINENIKTHFVYDLVFTSDGKKKLNDYLNTYIQLFKDRKLKNQQIWKASEHLANIYRAKLLEPDSIRQFGTKYFAFNGHSDDFFSHVMLYLNYLNEIKLYGFQFMWKVPRKDIGGKTLGISTASNYYWRATIDNLIFKPEKPSFSYENGTLRLFNETITLQKLQKKLFEVFYSTQNHMLSPEEIYSIYEDGKFNESDRSKVEDLFDNLKDKLKKSQYFAEVFILARQNNKFGLFVDEHRLKELTQQYIVTPQPTP